MLESVLSTAQADFDRHVERLQRYIRHKSVSAENAGNEEMAAMLAADINALGGTGRVVPGVDFPIVYGRFDVGAPRTVLIHSMYDTTPADEPTWVVPPFEARRMNFEVLRRMHRRTWRGGHQGARRRHLQHDRKLQAGQRSPSREPHRAV